MFYIKIVFAVVLDSDSKFFYDCLILFGMAILYITELNHAIQALFLSLHAVARLAIQGETLESLYPFV